MQAAAPDLDIWLPDPTIRVTHRRKSRATADQLWQAAEELSLAQTHLLGRLVRWRIPGVPAKSSFSELFRNRPFTVLAQTKSSLVSGLVGRIWTLRRDYPAIDPDVFEQWSESGTAKVLFAHWVSSSEAGGSTLHSETRLTTFGAQGRLGLASVRPLVRGFEHLVGTDALAAAVRRAERRR